MQPGPNDPRPRHEQPGCIGDIIGPVTWPAAAIVVAVVLAIVATGWLSDRDDARLDRLRETTVQACADHTESVQSLGDCVARTIRATGQPT